MAAPAGRRALNQVVSASRSAGNAVSPVSSTVADQAMRASGRIRSASAGLADPRADNVDAATPLTGKLPQVRMVSEVEKHRAALAQHPG